MPIPTGSTGENTAIFRPVDWIKDLAKFDPTDRDHAWRAEGEALALAKTSAQSISWLNYCAPVRATATSARAERQSLPTASNSRSAAWRPMAPSTEISVNVMVPSGAWAARWDSLRVRLWP